MTIDSNGLGNRIHIDLIARHLTTRASVTQVSFGSKVDYLVDRNNGYSESNGLAVLDRTVRNNLAKPASFELRDGNDFSVKSIAKNILSSVRQELREARNNGASEQELQSIINKASEGVQKGFAEAKDILQSRFDSEPRLERQIERAFNRVQRGLERIDNRFTPNIDVLDSDKSIISSKPEENTSKGLISESFAAGLSAQSTQVEFSKTRNVEKQRSFEISIQTQDGDTINLNIQKSLSKQVVKQATLSEEGLEVSFNKEVRRDKQFSYNVSGDISEQEQAAIDALLKKVNRLTDKFFDGNFVSAFKKATRIGIDTEQLASFSLNVQSSRSVEVIKTYREVQGVPLSQQVSSPLETVGEFVGDVAEVSSNPGVSNVVADPVSVTTELFKQIAYRDERYAQLAIEQSVEVIDKVINDVASLTEAQLIQAA